MAGGAMKGLRRAGEAMRRRRGGFGGVPLLLAALFVLGATAGRTAEGTFASWLADLRAEAARAGISASTLDAALTGVEPLPRVLELDRSQPEFTLTLAEYLARVVSDRRVAQGREKLRENRDLLARVARRYGVQPRFLVALWGIETDFGRLTGGFPVVPALATLAFDGRRSAYFRGELLDALRILDAGHIRPEEMVGSWAGAMGQPQFMPSSFRRFAVDFDGDGRADIWGTRADVFASAANYLARSGWTDGRTWGREARLPEGFDPALLGLETRLPLSRWQALGVRRADGRGLPRSPDLEASLVAPDGPGGQTFLVYDNYRALLTWNRSHRFGVAVGTLADRLIGR